MSPPYRSENKILHFAEMERVDSPLDRARGGQWDEPWRFELKMQAARFLCGNKGGQLGNARTEILPHQIFAAHRVVSSPRRRFLLADEVGLGKTIEAGMIWQALYQRGQAKRTLIITPAGLTTQWQEEMQDKFGATFEIFGRDFLAVNPRAGATARRPSPRWTVSNAPNTNASCSKTASETSSSSTRPIASAPSITPPARSRRR